MVENLVVEVGLINNKKFLIKCKNFYKVDGVWKFEYDERAIAIFTQEIVIYIQIVNHFGKDLSNLFIEL